MSIKNKVILTHTLAFAIGAGGGTAVYSYIQNRPKPPVDNSCRIIFNADGSDICIPWKVINNLCYPPSVPGKCP